MDIPSLRKVQGFTLLTQVCPESGQAWRMADDVIEIKSYFLAPPRVSSMLVEALNAEQAPSPVAVEEYRPPLTVIEPRVEMLGDKGALKPPAGMPDFNALHAEAEAKLEGPDAAPAGGPASLRIFCESCGYRNPRDVKACMKCATPLKAPSAAAVASPKEAAALLMEAMGIVPEAAKPATISPAGPATPAAVESAALPPNTYVEIPMSRIAIIVGIVSLCVAFAFVGWRVGAKKAHRWPWNKKPAVVKPSTAVQPAILLEPKSGPSRKRVRAAPRQTAVLPGMSSARPSAPPRAARVPKKEAPAESASSEASPEPGQRSAPASAAPSSSSEEAPVSYHVISEATPLQHRTPAPVESTYSQKRRADKGLWTAQQKQAIQQVQRYRIYGGQRTIGRNVEILIQILRDREYNTAFETGKRIYLYNDLDWSATQMEGPTYEVGLTFSGGKEADGSPRKPLRFAFTSDLDQGTAEPGGSEQQRSNTMHAFFDESRIAPEDRRAIAKDTEELVMAAQPEASPLAFDTVARNFVSTYGSPPMARVAEAFGLQNVTKRIVHEPKLVAASTEASDATTAPLSAMRIEKPLKKEDPAPSTPGKATMVPSKSGPIEYTMDRGSGRDRIFTAKAITSAKAGRLWEVTTSYDRLKDFVPDLLVSEREGQDGTAVIVHTVALTRLMIFVFKMNLHLRVIEHPRQHTLEFERIAGEFEQFRGSIEITSPTENGPSTMTLHATIVPKGHMPGWALNDMARRFLVPIVEALRTRAESY
jgi:hypothetical protein